MRCFIAAWPDPLTRVALAAVADDVRQRVAYRRATRIDDLHLTLAFIGKLDDEDGFAVADAISKIRFSPFTWRLDTLGFFGDAGIVWIGAARKPVKPLVALADRARSVLDGFDLDYDRRPLAPHVTLLRGVQQVPRRASCADYMGHRLDRTLSLRRRWRSRSLHAGGALGGSNQR